jgi:hypothetical protein
MSLTISIRVASIQLAEKLDLDELEALRFAGLENEPLRAAVDLVFETPKGVDSKTVRCGEFRQAVETLIREGALGLRAPVYYLYFSPMPGIIPKGSASGTGVDIGGERLTLMGGADECTLSKMAQDAQGNWTVVEVRDVRHEKVIRSDDGSEIEIRKRSKPGRTLRFLRRVREALKDAPADAQAVVTIG